MKHIKPYKIFEGKESEPQHPGFPKTEEEIHRLCGKYEIRDYSINEDLSIDVDRSVNLSFYQLKYIPLNFNIINGNFNCHHNEIVSLKGTPLIINGQFKCNNNNITSLKYFPEKISGYITFFANPIDLLIGKFINDNERNQLIEEFKEYSIIRGESVVVADRLKSFLNDFNLYYPKHLGFIYPNYDKISKHYKIV